MLHVQSLPVIALGAQNAVLGRSKKSAPSHLSDKFRQPPRPDFSCTDRSRPVRRIATSNEICPTSPILSAKQPARLSSGEQADDAR
jgi:hypothetical protein